jgi:hypothetical protein
MVNRCGRLPGLALLTVLAALGAVVSGAAGQTTDNDRPWHLMQKRANGGVVAEGLSANLTKHECEQAADNINPKFPPGGGWSNRAYMPEDVMTAECFQ